MIYYFGMPLLMQAHLILYNSLRLVYRSSKLSEDTGTPEKLVVLNIGVVTVTAPLPLHKQHRWL